jgi:hypothetical protein
MPRRSTRRGICGDAEESTAFATARGRARLWGWQALWPASPFIN